MIISDLSYLENVESNQVQGGYFDGLGFFEDDLLISNVLSCTNIWGNTAISEGFAVAEGYDTYTKVSNDVYTNPVASASQGFAIASTDSNYCYLC
jgi:hypothetical protein